MIERYIFNERQKFINQNEVKNLIENFGEIKKMIGDGRRNKVKIANIGDVQINIKAFKTPNIINQIAYKFFRKSKARRSYEYANHLLKVGIGTPQPIAYLDCSSFLLYKNGYYVSQHLDHDLTYRELIMDINYPNRESILRAFTRFTFLLHQNNINFLDHSPGNTLIRKLENGRYEFYLIDLNRMKFMDMDFDDRMKNFAKLSPKGDMLEIMSHEYSKLYPEKKTSEITARMLLHSTEFSTRYNRKERFKKKYFFWR
ncbi:MAG TPA: hypothetical protein VKZ98_00505 [Aquaticitalea sp.]|nr:hypothetical protein [Aquaticitalea sp.]